MVTGRHGRGGETQGGGGGRQRSRAVLRPRPHLGGVARGCAGEDAGPPLWQPHWRRPRPGPPVPEISLHLAPPPGAPPGVYPPAGRRPGTYYIESPSLWLIK